jgi:hypothetical protein
MGGLVSVVIDPWSRSKMVETVSSLVLDPPAVCSRV